MRTVEIPPGRPLTRRRRLAGSCGISRRVGPRPVAPLGRGTPRCLLRTRAGVRLQRQLRWRADRRAGTALSGVRRRTADIAPAPGRPVPDHTAPLLSPRAARQLEPEAAAAGRCPEAALQRPARRARWRHGHAGVPRGVDPSTTAERRAAVEHGLARYCELDTRALVELFRCFHQHGFSSPTPQEPTT